ncbi:metal-dependent hydrolase [[Eubacterium] cellulosolvens]
MFILGHIGLTIGLILLGLVLVKRTVLIKKIDLRIIAVFAVLPDIFDKVLGHLIFRESINNGRLFSHTLVFLVIFVVIFFLVLGANWWVYSFPILTHQLFDHLWTDPETWFWPAFGWGFQYKDINPWENWLSALIHNPYIQLTELLGLIVLLVIFIIYELYKKENLLRVMKTGNIVK